MLGEGGRQEQAGIGHQAVVIKDDADPVGIVLWQHLLGAPCFQAVFCSKTIIPDSEEYPLASSRTVPKVVFRWIRAKDTLNKYLYSRAVVFGFGLIGALFRRFLSPNPPKEGVGLAP